VLYIEALIKLIFVHAACDFGLQTPFLSFHKSPLVQSKEYWWPEILMAHSLITGAGVWWVTGNVWWGVLNTATHFGIDYLSTMKFIPHWMDQVLHVLVLAGIAWLWVRI